MPAWESSMLSSNMPCIITPGYRRYMQGTPPAHSRVADNRIGYMWLGKYWLCYQNLLFLSLVSVGKSSTTFCKFGHLSCSIRGNCLGRWHKLPGRKRSECTAIVKHLLRYYSDTFKNKLCCAICFLYLSILLHYAFCLLKACKPNWCA
jgi:hypothetical protein